MESNREHNCSELCRLMFMAIANVGDAVKEAGEVQAINDAAKRVFCDLREKMTELQREFD